MRGARATFSGFFFCRESIYVSYVRLMKIYPAKERVSKVVFFVSFLSKTVCVLLIYMIYHLFQQHFCFSSQGCVWIFPLSLPRLISCTSTVFANETV